MQKVYTKIESIVGNVVTVRAEGVKYGDLALVGDRQESVPMHVNTRQFTQSILGPSIPVLSIWIE